jgi:phage-related protein
VPRRRALKLSFHISKRVPIGIGLGVSELRIHTGLEHRVFYIAKFSEGIYVLHAFQKKTRKTPKKELDLASRRLRELTQQREGRK